MNTFIRFCVSLPLLCASVQGMAATCIAHRGLSSAAQENTLEAVLAAWESGLTLVEIDLQLTADGVVVLFHDAEIEKERIDGLTYAELETRTPFYHVPPFKELLTVCPEGLTLLLDLKEDSPRFVDALVACVTNTPTRIIFQSRSLSTLRELFDRIKNPTLLFLSSLDREGPLKTAPDAQALAQQLVDNHIQGITAKGRQFVTKDFVSAFKKHGLIYYVWTINQVDRMEYYLTCGVDGIITDRPDLFPQSPKDNPSE